MVGPDAMPDLHHIDHMAALDVLEENIIEGNDPLEVGRRVQYQIQHLQEHMRLNTTDRVTEM